jgi:isopentenyl-diphosphate delta-isomerase
MGMTCPVEHAFHFTYRAEFDNGLTEHELDHVFIGISDQLPRPDAEEVENWKYLPPEVVLDDLRRNPQAYTAWFPLALRRIMEHGLVSRVA